jgi:hypothetical protein
MSLVVEGFLGLSTGVRKTWTGDPGKKDERRQRTTVSSKRRSRVSLVVGVMAGALCAFGSATPGPAEHVLPGEARPLTPPFLYPPDREESLSGVNPKVVVYADGTVLFTGKERCSGEPHCECQLSVERLSRLRSELTPSNEFLALHTHYALDSTHFDLPEMGMLLSGGKRK